MHKMPQPALGGTGKKQDSSDFEGIHENEKFIA